MWNELIPISIAEYLDNQKPYLSAQQVKEIINDGHSIGSHTKTHPNCSLLNSSELEDEISTSITRLNKKFDTKVLAFAYPFGMRPTAINKKKGFENVKVELGIMPKINSNNASPTNWERLNMETSSFRSRLFIDPLKNTILH